MGKINYAVKPEMDRTFSVHSVELASGATFSMWQELKRFSGEKKANAYAEKLKAKDREAEIEEENKRQFEAHNPYYFV